MCKLRLRFQQIAVVIITAVIGCNEKPSSLSPTVDSPDTPLTRTVQITKPTFLREAYLTRAATQTNDVSLMDVVISQADAANRLMVQARFVGAEKACVEQLNLHIPTGATVLHFMAKRAGEELKYRNGFKRLDVFIPCQNAVRDVQLDYELEFHTPQIIEQGVAGLFSDESYYRDDNSRLYIAAIALPTDEVVQLKNVQLRAFEPQQTFIFAHGSSLSWAAFTMNMTQHPNDAKLTIWGQQLTKKELHRLLALIEPEWGVKTVVVVDSLVHEGAMMVGDTLILSRLVLSPQGLFELADFHHYKAIAPKLDGLPILMDLQRFIVLRANAERRYLTTLKKRLTAWEISGLKSALALSTMRQAGDERTVERIRHIAVDAVAQMGLKNGKKDPVLQNTSGMDEMVYAKASAYFDALVRLMTRAELLAALERYAKEVDVSEFSTWLVAQAPDAPQTAVIQRWTAGQHLAEDLGALPTAALLEYVLGDGLKAFGSQAVMTAATNILTHKQITPQDANDLSGELTLLITQLIDNLPKWLKNDAANVMTGLFSGKLNSFSDWRQATRGLVQNLADELGLKGQGAQVLDASLNLLEILLNDNEENN